MGDDGRTQRLATLCDISECSSVEVEEIPADQSGRSFLVKVPDGETFYFWCSEKSKLLGSDLLSKIKDLLKTKPTLAELTSISESRLECFATHLRGYLVGPNVNKTQAGAASLSSTSMDVEPADRAVGLNTQSTSISGRPLRARQSSVQSLKGHAQYQGILSPRSSSFKEGGPRPLSSFRNASKERLRRRGDICLPAVDSSFVTDAVLNLSENGKQLEVSGSMSSPFSFLESLGEKHPSPPPCASSQFPPISSRSSPYYCWCPPCTFPITSVAQLPSLSTEPFSLPPLPSFLAATGPPTLCTQIPPLDLAAIPPLEFPTLVSDPLSRLPFSKQSSQQIPTFVPLMCDPIVHIPIVDVCSSGQGYLVSAGPALATNIPPLHPKLVGPMMPESESIVEKGARETLRLLIANSGSQPSASLMEVLPAVLNEDKKAVVVAGSRGLYSGTSDVGAIVSSFACVGLSSISERPMKVKGCGGSSDVLEQTSSGLDLQDSSFMSEEDDW